MFVLVMGITFALILAVFGVLVETRWLDIITDLYPFRLLYGLFFLNLVAFGIGWVPVVIRRCQAAELSERAAHQGRFEQASEIPGPGLRIADLARHLRRRGYRIAGAAAVNSSAASECLLYAHRGRYSMIGNLLFHAAFLLLLWGAVANSLYRFEGTAIIEEGGSFRGGKDEYRTISAPPAAALPAVDFDVQEIVAEFWEGKLFFTRLEAQLVHSGGRDLAELSAAARVGNAAVTISGYAYAPLYVLKNRRGDVVSRARVKLNIVGPGNEDWFQVPGYPHKIFVALYPDHQEVDGKLTNRSLNPVNPAYFLRIMRGRIPLFTGVVKPNEWAEYDGLSISFPSLTRTGSFQIVRNPGNPLIWTAFLMMGAGLAWRLLLYRRDVVLWRDGEGRMWLSGRTDYHRKLHANWLASLAGTFRGTTG